MTKTIAGHQITLSKGQQYYASRPIASRKRQIFPVNIKTIDDQSTVKIINDLTYEQANELVNEFNNGPISWSGRTW